MSSETKPKVLVKEKIADRGVDLLREHFDVDLGVEWDDAELASKIGDYDAILIRSATQLTEELIDKATNLKVIGRAGIGVDNVDVPAATRRGIVVANAPTSNIVTAAEHTMALILALARNVPQAHKSLTSGKWERSKFGGVEVYEKTLGILGLGRIGQLVAERARGFEMRLLGYDPFVTPERFRELGVERAETPEDLYAQADFITIHLPKTEETRGFLNDAAFAAMRDGVRVVNVARGELLDDEALVRAIDSGKVKGAALDVFSEEPITDHPLFSGYDGVIVTPHLGASTVEAQDRAGEQTAEQIIAALTGGTVTTAVNIPSVSSKDREYLEPFLPLCEQVGALAIGLAPGTAVERIEIEFLGRVAEYNTGLLTTAVLKGALTGSFADDVNYVNAPALAEERGVQVIETKAAERSDYTDLVRVTVSSAEGQTSVAGTVLGALRDPYMVEAWGQRFNLKLEPHVVVFRYEDRPGMIGRIGTIFGERGINISSAAVGRQPEDAGSDGLAAMAVTTETSVPPDVVLEIIESAGFEDGRAVELG